MIATETHEVVLVRHGETEWSRTGLHTGRTDIALTETGRRQADQLAGMLDGRPFALAMSSPLIRARETYERAGLTITAEITDDLLEWDYGAYEGVSTPGTRDRADQGTAGVGHRGGCSSRPWLAGLRNQGRRRQRQPCWYRSSVGFVDARP